MKIGIDSRMIEHSGIGTCLRNLISRLPAISVHDYILFGDKAKLERYGLPVVEADFPIYGLKEQTAFPAIIKKARVDLFHSPHYIIPLIYAGKIVVTVNDLNHLIFPEYLSSRLAYYYAKFMIGAACKKSAGVITISENTRKDIIRFLNPPESKIDVVSLGVDESFRPGVAGADNAPRKIYGRYLLYVGLIRPHKNILRLIDAFAKLKKQDVIEHKLILIGKKKGTYSDDLNERINRHSLGQDIIILEKIKPQELADFYRGAEIFVFPSLYEGFGLPPLEAMASGCPVVTSNTSSLPEVVGDAGLMVNPYDVDELAGAIHSLLRDENLRQKMIKRGLDRSKIFSWDDTAKETLKIYEKVLSS